jgi:hypothetical protein
MSEQRLSDENVRRATELALSPIWESIADELLESRKALRELAALAWHPTHLIQNINHYRKILTELGYAPQGKPDE